jgi:hypothetical protein
MISHTQISQVKENGDKVVIPEAAHENAIKRQLTTFSCHHLYELLNT